MGCKRQSHLVKMNINIRMMIVFLSFPGDSIYKSDAFQKPRKLKCPNNRLTALRPFRNGVYVGADLFGG